MGPTNVALVNLYKADQQLREARARLDAAERNVRIQERRVNDLAEKARLAQGTLREQQTRQRTIETDLATRDAHIEKLRTQQQNAKNNKEYQAFLVEINTEKVDRNKVEEEGMRLLETVDKGQRELDALQQHAEAERAKLQQMKAEIGDTVAKLQAEVEALRPARDAAAAAVPVRVREAFERLADHHEGEAMSAIAKPDRRREEYLCTACNMELAQDVYNKLRTRDEVVYCPSCRRILYIPENLSPEDALSTSRAGNKPKVSRTTTKAPRKKAAAGQAAGATASTGAGAAGAREPVSPAVEIELRAKGRLGQILAKSQAESVHSAVGGGAKPVELEVYVDGTLAGIYKGKSADHLQRAIRYFMEEQRMPGEVRVSPVPASEEPQSEDASGAASPDAAAPATDAPGAAVANVDGNHPDEPSRVAAAAESAPGTPDSGPTAGATPAPEAEASPETAPAEAQSTPGT